MAEHTWRLCLMAMVVGPLYEGVDQLRLLRMCVIHDLGEAIRGDIPATEQQDGALKAVQERRDFRSLIQPLDPTARSELLELWDEYAAAETPEARLAKALDKLETLIQHNQGANPPDFDYAFNLHYGRDHTDPDALTREMRGLLDRQTRQRSAGG